MLTATALDPSGDADCPENGRLLEVFVAFGAALDGCPIHTIVKCVDKAGKARATVKKAKPS
jgi:hypothetical protein